MFTHKQALQFVAVIILNSVAASAMAVQLSLEQAEQLAVERDAVVKMQHVKSKSYLEKSVAANTLPDPRISLGLMNYPTDTFDREQEPMTQTRIAIQQMLPRGDTLSIKSKKHTLSSDMNRASAINREAMVKMELRTVYLELLYWLRAEEIVKKNKKLFSKLVKITQSHYASGVQKQQDVIRAGLELEMLDDRLDSIRTKQQQTHAKLLKLVGTDTDYEIDTSLPELAEFEATADIKSSIVQHPIIRMHDAMVDNRKYGIELQRQSYKPAWMFEVSYGFRDGTNPNGSERADFASAMVSLDIPLFTKNKQDRQVAASRLDYQAALDNREEKLRQLISQYKQAFSKWEILGDRLKRYRESIIPQSHENAKAALYAYQSRRGNFTSLMRAQITELETSLKHIRLHTHYLQSQAKLLYLVGEAK